MFARVAVRLVVACGFALLENSAALCAEDAPATPSPPAKSAPKKTLAELEQEYKDLTAGKQVGSTYRVIGEMWALVPQRIPVELPGLVKNAALSKSSHSYLPALLQPAAKDCVPTLIKMLQSDEATNHYPASAGLRTIVDAARPALEELSAAGPTRVRAEAIRILGGDRKDAAVDSTAQKLKALLDDPESELQVEAALALLELKVDEARIGKVLEQNFPQQGERIMLDALASRKAAEAFRGVLTLALNQKDKRGWRIESAIQLAGLDKKLSSPVQAALLDGLSKHQDDPYRLAEKCAIALNLPAEDAKPAIDALTRLCHDGNTSLDLAATAAATLVQIDREHAPAYVPYLLTYVSRPRYRTEKARYLVLIGKLGKQGRGAEATLSDLLTREGGTSDLLMAIVLLNVDPERPNVAQEFLREALAGKRRAGSIGLNQIQDLTLNCTPLMPEILAAIESDDAARRDAAYDLVEHGGASALPALPALEKRLNSVNRIEAGTIRVVITKLKTAKP